MMHDKKAKPANKMMAGGMAKKMMAGGMAKADTQKMMAGGKVKKGYHKMPDGTMMKDSEHKAGGPFSVKKSTQVPSKTRKAAAKKSRPASKKMKG